MAKFTTVCQICGKVLGSRESSAYAEDTISHITCNRPFCKKKLARIFSGKSPAYALQQAYKKDPITGVKVAFEDYDTPTRTVEIASIEATPQGKGLGTRAMARIIALAEEQGTNLMLVPAGTGTRFERLVDYYGRFGFELQGSTMFRQSPKASKRLNNPVQRAEDVGWRAGAPRVSETLREMAYGRSSGHFGTGTYFFGRKERAIDYAAHRQLGDRRVHRIDLTGLNLFKVGSYEQGEALHKALKTLNNAVWTNGYENVGFSRKFPNMKPVNWAQLAIDLRDAGLEFTTIDSLMYAFHDTQNDKNAGRLNTPTASTRFMRLLGYQGIDVRDVSGLDTSEWGSVVYTI